MANEKTGAKKLEEFKETKENREAVAKDTGVSVESNKVGSKPAVVKAGGKEKKEKKNVVELEREYVVPLRRGFLNVPRYRRAKKAVRILKEFMVRHMVVRDGDLKKVKVNIHLNNEIWFRGIKNPLNKVRVKAKKIDGIVYVELADASEIVKFRMAREAKAKLAAEGGKKDVKKVEEKVQTDKDKDGVEDKIEEKEDKKAETERAERVAGRKSREMKHTAQGKHKDNTTPIRKVLK